MREQLEQHRANPTCASCHSRMDPIGFALENYDAIGKWRVKDGTSEIDISGKAPGRQGLRGPGRIEEATRRKLSRRFRPNVLSEKLLIYATGRGIEAYDHACGTGYHEEGRGGQLPTFLL